MLPNNNFHEYDRSLTLDKIPFFTKNPILFLIIVGSIGLSIRLCYLPAELPISLDAMTYFVYALEISETGRFPVGYELANNGWPTFLSVFFYFFHSNDLLHYMILQRFVTVMLSILTIIPVYLLCKRFFSKPYALIGSSLFVFEPHLLNNSLLGLTEPLYILLGTLALYFYFNNKTIYISFGLAALFALVRYEGLLLVIPFSIMYFTKFKKEKKYFLKYLLCLSIFFLVLLPMVMVRFDTTGKDGLISHLSAGQRSIYENKILQEGNEAEPFYDFFTRAMSGLTKYLIFIMIPFFIFLIPYGLYKFFRNRSYEKNTIILYVIFLLIPSFYVYGRTILDPRYVFIVIPIFCIFSIYTIEQLDKKIVKQGVLMILLLGGVILSSIIYLEYDKIDYNHLKEAYLIAKHVVKTTNGINDEALDGQYIKATEIIHRWPLLSSVDKSGRIISDIEKASTLNFTSLEEFINKSKSNGLTHLVIDGKPERASFLNDVFFHEEKYPYLIKEFDSIDHGFNYEVKIYRIDYDLFAEFAN